MERLKRQIRWIDRADRAFAALFCTVMVLGLLLTGSALLDGYRLTAEGIRPAAFHGFGELMAVNRDTAAWLRLEGTHIDHPVVQGKDNFEYLDRNFRGSFYAGGSLFLDAGCSRDMSDRILIIHGHDMAGGAMFGDLKLFADPPFFRAHGEGELLTPEGDYALLVAGIARVNAYDPAVYDEREDLDRVLERLTLFESGAREVDWAPEDRLLLLSTCAGEGNDERTVVFCRMREEGDE